LKHFASLAYWLCYRQVPEDMRALADKSFELLKDNPRHPSIRLK
jgi:hypothetical protein